LCIVVVSLIICEEIVTRLDNSEHVMFMGYNLSVSHSGHVEMSHKGCECFYQYVRPTVVPNFSLAIFFGLLFIAIKPQAKENSRATLILLFYILQNFRPTGKKLPIVPTSITLRHFDTVK
jgi:hypothetical protein